MYQFFFRLFSHLGCNIILINGSLINTVGPNWLSILNVAVGTCQSQAPYLVPFYFWGILSFGLSIWCLSFFAFSSPRTSMLLNTTKCSRLILHIVLPSPESSKSSRNSGSLYRRMLLEISI